jgi:hypothetical protein
MGGLFLWRFALVDESERVQTGFCSSQSTIAMAFVPLVNFVLTFPDCINESSVIGGVCYNAVWGALEGSHFNSSVTRVNKLTNVYPDQAISNERTLFLGNVSGDNFDGDD